MATAKKSQAQSTEVALKQEGAISPFAQAEVPAYLQNSGPARGSENVGSGDIVLPRLELVQSQSPIREEEGIDCEEGQLYNSVTHEIYGDFVYFVPIYYRMEYLIWQHKDINGGGFHGAFNTQDEANMRLKQILANDPDLIGEVKGKGVPKIEVIDTPIQYGFRVDPDGTTEQLVISMPRTKAKVSRKWNAMIQLAGGDRFARVYKITGVGDQNKKGEKFKNFQVQPAGFTPETVYRAAEALYEVFKSGAMSVRHETVIDGEEDTNGQGNNGGLE